MKFSNLRAFEKHVEASSPGHFSNTYLLVSKEPFELKSASEKLVHALMECDKQGFTRQTFDAETHAVDSVLAELRSLGLFAGKRVVILNNCDKLDKNGMAKLEGYFNAPDPSAYFILTASTLNRTMTFYKRAEKAGIILDIPEEKPWEREKSLVIWVVSAAAERKKNLAEKTAQLLLKQIGMDQELLSHELDKLSCFVGERTEITLKDVHMVSISCNLENIWQLGEALFKKEAAAALRIGRALLAEGTALIALLKQIRSQFQNKLQICSILANGGSAQDVASKFPYMKGQILERNIKMAAEYGLESLKKGLFKIDEAELSAKNSGLDSDLLFDLLLVKLTT